MRLVAFILRVFAFFLLWQIALLYPLRQKPSTAEFILFVTQSRFSWDIWQMSPDGTHQQLLVSDVGDARPTPRWLPSGTGFVYDSEKNNRVRLYERHLFSANSTPLPFTLHADIFYPSWSTDGHWIAFNQRFNGRMNLYIARMDSSEPRAVVRDSYNVFFPALSPTGQTIAFFSDRDGNDEIYTIQRDGSQLTRLTNAVGGDYAPSWSPDGEWIVFHAFRGDQLMADIYKMRADGSALTQLTFALDNDFYPTWSADGAWIVFQSKSATRPYQIYKMRADGSDLQPLTNAPLDHYAPVWSPRLDFPYHAALLVGFGLFLLIVPALARYSARRASTRHDLSVDSFAV